MEEEPKPRKLGCYLLNRIINGTLGKLNIRQYATLVGITDNITDSVLVEAMERLKSDMKNVLDQFKDPSPVIDCVLAYHFLERESPIVLTEKDRKDIDAMFDTLKRFYEEEWKNGEYRKSFKPGYTDQDFEGLREDTPDEIMHSIMVEDRAQGIIRQAIGYRRYIAWQIEPERGPGRRGGQERIRICFKVSPRTKEDPLADELVSSFIDDLSMARALASELASISRHQTKRDPREITREAIRRAKRGTPQDHLCEPLFRWVFGNAQEDYPAFRGKSEPMNFYNELRDITNPRLVSLLGTHRLAYRFLSDP